MTQKPSDKIKRIKKKTGSRFVWGPGNFEVIKPRVLKTIGGKWVAIDADGFTLANGFTRQEVANKLREKGGEKVMGTKVKELISSYLAGLRDRGVKDVRSYVPGRGKRDVHKYISIST